MQWSSEYCDEELTLVYYNYRHYNSADGRWINRDPIAEKIGNNVYRMILNNPVKLVDLLGLIERGPFDGKHPTVKSCSFGECCQENIKRFSNGSRHPKHVVKEILQIIGESMVQKNHGIIIVRNF